MRNFTNGVIPKAMPRSRNHKRERGYLTAQLSQERDTAESFWRQALETSDTPSSGQEHEEMLMACKTVRIMALESLYRNQDGALVLIGSAMGKLHLSADTLPTNLMIEGGTL